MSYIEERIKYRAVQTWQMDKSKKEIKCPMLMCDGKSWGGTITPRMRVSQMSGEMICELECHDCGHQYFIVPDEVIDNFLDRI